MKFIKLGAVLTWAACIISGLGFVTMFMPWLLVFVLPIAIFSLKGINREHNEDVD